MSHEDATDSAFLDVAANTLAILIMITMFALITVQRTIDGSDHAAAVEDPPMPFVARNHQLFQPFSEYWFVLGDGLVRWNQEALVDALDKAGLFSGAVATEQGLGQLEAAGIVFHDLDSFSVTFHPDLDHLRASAVAPEPAHGTPGLVEVLVQRYRDGRRAPVFLVYAEGMDVFAQLFDELNGRGIRMRWFPWRAEDPLTVVRNVSQFTLDEMRW